MTDWMMVSRGFPQGSGHYSSTFLSRKLPQQCISTTIQFADDSTLAIADPSLSVVGDNLTASFIGVKQFCQSQSHDLIINSDKTQLIMFKTIGKVLPDQFQLLLDNCTIKPQKTIKLFGVTLDQHFAFGAHRQCRQQMSMTYRMSGTSNTTSTEYVN